jgi:alcohol dehydrogenase
MKAHVVDRYGKDSTLRAQQMPEPEIGGHDALVRIAAAGVNPLDAKIMAGEFRLVLPYKPPFVLGNDLAGVVERTGPGVHRFALGDEVYARPDTDRIATFAGLISISEDDLAPKPAGLTMAQAASLPLVALTAWQALAGRANVKAGQKVLIHAGSGGVGTIAIQLAKYLGAYVATTTSTANLEWVRGLGADLVVDYASRTSSRLCGTTTSCWTPSAARTWRSPCGSCVPAAWRSGSAGRPTPASRGRWASRFCGR